MWIICASVILRLHSQQTQAPSRNLSNNADCAISGSSTALCSIYQDASRLLRHLGHQMGRPRDARMSPTVAALFVFVLGCNLMVTVSSGKRPLPAYFSHFDTNFDFQRNWSRAKSDPLQNAALTRCACRPALGKLMASASVCLILAGSTVPVLENTQLLLQPQGRYPPLHLIRLGPRNVRHK